MDRRAFLRGIGTLTVVAAGSGGEWLAFNNHDAETGFEPWTDWRDHASDGPLALVRAAILAASPHNTQPWRFHVTQSAVDLILDRQRNVGALDPFLREESIGMGCALENLLLAAQANGYSATASVFPAPLTQNTPESTSQFETVARVTLTPANREESELYQAIPHRHTNRSPYDPQVPLPTAFLDELRRLPHPDEEVRVCLFTDQAARGKIAEISQAANETLYSDAKIEAASQSWIRLTRKDVRHFQDGITVDAFGLSPTMTTIAKALPTGILSRMEERGQRQGYAERMLTAPMIGILAVRNRYDRAQCLLAGQLWQRAHLLATARGIAARPCSEAIELIDYERLQNRPANTLTQLGHLTGEPDWQPIFLFLMGHPTHPAGPSPRRRVNAVLDA